ncbi:MAG TPA: MetS family NSS transporter small subunit [Thermoanaerobaculia bacterium]|nr:MetS family NSS transporter small subunit [Thermoanaerobaculia bacterium]
MSPLAVVVMVLVCGTVWGGFALLLTRAVRREGGKRREEAERPERRR